MRLDRIIAVRNDKTIYRDGERCIKIFRDGYSKADILNEALNAARVEETGLPIPRVLEVARIDDKWAIVLEYAKGKTLSRMMEEDPTRKAEYIARLVELQCGVHRRRCELLNPLKDKLRMRIKESVLSKSVRNRLIEALNDMPESDCICHGDFTPSNIVMDTDGTVSILDWAHVTRGSASADAAITCLQLLSRGSSDEAEIYLSEFCRVSGTARDEIRRWLPVVAAARLTHCKEHEREFLARIAETEFTELPL